MKTYPFEGQQLTLTEICAEVPALSRETIRIRLRDGYTNRVDMLAKRAPKVVVPPGSRMQYSLRAKQ